MPVVYLIRHGQASFGATDYDVLSEVGRRQALILGTHLREHGVQPAFARSGTMRRQIDTAAICLAELGSTGTRDQDERWNEFSMADVAGAGNSELAMVGVDRRAFQAQLEQAISAWIARSDQAVGVENWADFDARVWAALDDVFARLSARQVATVFTSGGVISALVARILGVPAAGYVALHRVSLNAAVTKVLRGSTGTSVASFNAHGHLEGPGSELITHM